MLTEFGKLYVVATPIGNLADISFRAVEILKQVDLIAAEDTRHVKMLLQHYGITNNLVSLHQHNEDKASAVLLEKLRVGQSIALVSDAGTPLLYSLGPRGPILAATAGPTVLKNGIAFTSGLLPTTTFAFGRDALMLLRACV